MKKPLLFLAAALVAFSASAREFTFWLGDQQITPGQTIEFNDYELVGGALLQMKPNLMVSSDIYTSKAIVTADCTSGQSIQMCCGGQCSSGTTVVKENVKIQTGQKVALDYEYLETKPFSGTLPTIVTEFSVRDAAYEGTETGFVLYMGPEGCYVSAVDADSPVAVTPAGLRYNLPNGGTVEIFSITGASVLKTTVKGSGLVETAQLSRGVYIYTVSAPGCSRSGKMVVK